MMEDLAARIMIWLKNGVIEGADMSPWNFPVSPVSKKDREIRWVMDFRGLNKVTREDSYPIPNITELLT